MPLAFGMAERPRPREAPGATCAHGGARKGAKGRHAFSQKKGTLKGSAMVPCWSKRTAAGERVLKGSNEMLHRN